MNSQVTLTGMVLEATNVGDYDKRLVILTGERGKITAFAKGARRPNSHYGACSRPFVFGRFALFQGRESYSLADIEVKNYFNELSLDLDKVYTAMYFLELASYFSRENVEARDMLNLLYATLTAEKKGEIELRLIRIIFELKIFHMCGIYPQVFSCMCCGGKENLAAFSMKKKGALCADCAGAEMRVDTSTLYTMQYIIANPVEKLFKFRVSDRVCDELRRIMKTWISSNCDKNFKCAEFLG